MTTVVYNFMPVLDWIRTDVRHRLPDGTECLRFDPARFAAFEIFALQRPGAAADYAAETVDHGTVWWQSLDADPRRRGQPGLAGACEQHAGCRAVRRIASGPSVTAWRRAAWAAAVLLAVPLPAWAQDEGGCGQAVATVEAEQALPPGLLAAISLVESGRAEPGSRQWAAWPWTVNIHGAGHFYASKTDAVAAVQAVQAAGERVVDVGCMQINLLAHPAAFASLDEAFDPLSNVRYAAGFLRRLHDESADWTRAAAAYHSRTPELGAAYAARVAAVLGGGVMAVVADLSARVQTVFGSPALVRYGVALPPPSAALPAGTVPLVRMATDASWIAVRLPTRHRKETRRIASR